MIHWVVRDRVMDNIEGDSLKQKLGAWSRSSDVFSSMWCVGEQAVGTRPGPASKH